MWRISDVYGKRIDPFTGKAAFHQGLDLACAAGTAVRAVQDGVVTAAAYSPSYGNHLRILHPDGCETRYAHLQYLYVRPGEVVQAGQTLGTVGQTGRATGAHLHLELWQQGAACDPRRSAGECPLSRVRAGKLVFRDPVLLCGAVYLLLYFDASGFLRLGLLAAILHELGHIFVYCIQQRHLPVIEVTMTGFLYAHGRGEAFSAPAACAGRRRACGQFCPCRGMGGASCASCYHPRQRVLGGKSADGAVQPFANPAAGWCTDGSVCRGAVAAKTRKVCTNRRKRLQNRHIWGKIKERKKRIVYGGPDV